MMRLGLCRVLRLRADACDELTERIPKLGVHVDCQLPLRQVFSTAPGRLLINVGYRPKAEVARIEKRSLAFLAASKRPYLSHG